MKIYSLKRKSIPKVAVLATGMAAAVMVATVNMAPAQANPSNPGSPNCTECHIAGGSVTATPNDATPAAGATYTVALAFTGSTSTTAVGYRITRTGETAVTASDASTAAMTAPAAAGTYTYTVWMRSGVVATTTYSITVAAASPTTPAPTTPAPTTPAPTTPPATTPPATTVPPTVVPTVVPTTIPPVVAPAVVPVGAPATGAGGTAQSNGSPLMGFGGLALLLSGAAMVTAIRRRRQV